MIVLILLKWGINVAYEEGYFSPDNIKYSFITMRMTSINTEQFGEFIQTTDKAKSVLIYMGRKTCPVCIKLFPTIRMTFDENKTLENGNAVQQYYFDSEKYRSEKTKNLRESIGANYVPSIIVINAGELCVFDADEIALDGFSEKITELLNANNV